MRPALALAGFHLLDACHPRDTGPADDRPCLLVAHHLCAQIEAEQHGPGAELASEFKPALADALIYCWPVVHA